MARQPDSHPYYASRPSRSATRGAEGFYTSEGEDTNDVDERTREYGERPHGLGNFESNYGLASSEPRRVDTQRLEPARDHRGKGPKGYQRTDERVRERLCEVLTDDPRIDATDIDVHVQGGEITLTGFVDSRRTKYLVEELVANTCDTEVTNRLQVRRPQDSPEARETARNWLID
jgi:BON domain